MLSELIHCKLSGIEAYVTKTTTQEQDGAIVLKSRTAEGRPMLKI